MSTAALAITANNWKNPNAHQQQKINASHSIHTMDSYVTTWTNLKKKMLREEANHTKKKKNLKQDPNFTKLKTRQNNTLLFRHKKSGKGYLCGRSGCNQGRGIRRFGGLIFYCPGWYLHSCLPYDCYFECTYGFYALFCINEIT